MTSNELPEGISLRNRLQGQGRGVNDTVNNRRRSYNLSESNESYRLGPGADTFSNINERPVDDISIEFFYKPHTITLLLISTAAVIYFAFVR